MAEMDDYQWLATKFANDDLPPNPTKQHHEWLDEVAFAELESSRPTCGGAYGRQQQCT